MPYEEDLVRNCYEPKCWLRYLDHKRSSSEAEDTNFVYERALKVLPGCYKLWKAYLDERATMCLQKLTLVKDSDGYEEDVKKEFEFVNGLFERCLLYMSRMPRIWIDYIQFLMKQRRLTQTRQVINRSLQALPISQHQRIWEVALKFGQGLEGRCNLGLLRIWERYWQVAPRQSYYRQYLDLLMRLKQWDRAALVLLELAQDNGDEAGQHWEELCDLIMTHGDRVKNVDPERILRIALTTTAAQTNQSGVYWAALAMIHIRRRQFDAARQVYEEAITSVPSVRDFSIIFDAYSKFEESLLAADLDKRLHQQTESGDLIELDLRLVKLENLFIRRPFLVQEIRLRQHPNSVTEWSKYIQLTKKYGKDVVEAYERALTCLNPRRAKGDLPALWNEFALYFQPEDLQSAEAIFRKAVSIDDWASLDDHASIWIHFAEFKRSHEGIAAAIDLIGEAVSSSKTKKSGRLWNYLVDLEEARGTAPESVKAAYEQILALGLATLQTILNYALFMEETYGLDEAFRIYERGISIFGWPIAFDLWNIYLPKAIARWVPSGNLERIRDLFEQALQGCPETYLKPIYLMLVALEEQHGLPRSALKVLGRACKAVPPSDRLELYQLLLSKTIQQSGIVYARPVYESAISSAALPLEALYQLSLDWAALEARLGEFERARAIYGHAGSLADPRCCPALWEAWSAFEVAHGDETSFREMLRLKRAAQAKYMTAPTAFVPAAQPDEAGTEETDQKEIVNDEEIQLDLE